MSIEDRNKRAFREEALELLTELEESLLELEEKPTDEELINRVFRAMHTIKGSGAMFGFEDIATFTHEVETVFDLVRNNKLHISKDLLDLTLLARDQILSMLEGNDSGKSTQAEKVISGLKKIARNANSAGVDSQPEQPDPEQEEPQNIPLNDEQALAYSTFRIRFKPCLDFFMTGSQPYFLIEELSELGRSRVVQHNENIPEWDKLDPEKNYLWWDIILHTDKGRDEILDVFIFVEDDCDLEVTLIDKSSDQKDSNYKKLGEILIEKGDLTHEELRQILQSQKPLGEILISAGKVSKKAVESALVEQQEVREIKQTRKAAQAVGPTSSIRVPALKLDQLVDLVGELVIAQARLYQHVQTNSNPVLASISEEIERLSDGLRDSTLGIRMLPIGTTFSKFKRLVRDLCSDLGKDISLVTHGAETELDKTVIERLNDPLVHLLRNSIDHGIETPDVRLKKNKSAKGTITLSAEHSGGEVIIKIIDDGAGIDPDYLRSKAVEKGVITPDAQLSRQDSLNLIFAPGFSTAQKVTNVSGRGVGMDVVKKNIDALRGRIQLESEIEKGTVITVRIPLTLAIIDGLQVKVGDDHFILPLSHVEECVELIRSESDCRSRKKVINIRGEIVPYISLRDCFQINTSRPDIEQVVITTAEGIRVGIVVDHVIGEHQTVIKNLGRVYRDVPGLSGATIKGDGSMALILDIPNLVNSIS